MDAAALLAAYDDQLRREAEVRRAAVLEEAGPSLRGVFPWGGFVTYRDLAGLEGEELDALIADTVRWFRDEHEVDRFEWKTRGHDAPADLPDRLLAHGLVAEPRETVMIGEASALAVDVPLPDGATVERITERDDLVRLLELQETVFRDGHGPRLEEAVRELESGAAEYWWVTVDGVPVSAGKLEVPGTEFAGIWGGGTLEEWRGRGLYRALTAARARSALAQGVRFLHSDSTDMSRPILERSGLVPVTTTTPYVWHR